MDTSAFAQSSGQLRFRFEPDKGMEYVLDGQYRMRDRELTLMEGGHRFVFWAPERLMLDTTLMVQPNGTSDVLVRLRYAQDFVDHRRALQRYERNQKWGRILPPLVSLGTGVWAGISIAQAAKADQDLQDLSDSYNTLADPAGIQRLKEQAIPEAQDELARARSRAYLATGVFAVSVATTYIIRKQLSRRVAPVYEDKERVRFEGLVWMPGINGGTWATSLSVPLQ